MRSVAFLLLVIVSTFLYAIIPAEFLPPILDPVLMTVWGSSVELSSVNYFCEILFIARDYSKTVTLEDAKKGAGFGITSDSTSSYFHDFYTPGTSYKSFIIIAGGSTELSKADISRIKDVAMFIKEPRGLVVIIDIDVESTDYDSIKEEFASAILPYVDILILADSPIENYSQALQSSTPVVISLPTIVDLMLLFIRDFGAGGCCD